MIKISKFVLLTVIIFSFPTFIYSQTIKKKFQLKQAEIAWVNYLQSEGNAHSLQLAWVPSLYTLVDKIQLDGRVGFTVVPSLEDDNIIITSLDMLPSYKLSNKMILEGIVGLDIWQSEVYFETGLNILFNANEFSILKEYEFLVSEFYFGYSYIFSDPKKASNISIGIRKTFN